MPGKKGGGDTSLYKFYNVTGHVRYEIQARLNARASLNMGEGGLIAHVSLTY